MEIIIAGEAKEIAALVLGVQERQTGKYGNISGISEYSPDRGTDRMYPGIVSEDVERKKMQHHFG